jgi:hypothetical protein
MKKSVILILLILVGFSSISQINVNLSGRVTDMETKEPLPYAKIFYLKKSLGTVTNLDGNFTISISEANEMDSIIISYVGYEPIRTVVGKCLKKDKFELKPKVVELDEVVAKAGKFRLNDFIKGVITDYNSNRRNYPHIAIAHYREKARYKGHYIMFMESIGYSVFSGDSKYGTPLSNYKFFCENTKCHVDHPEWLKYMENSTGYPYSVENVSSADGTNLNVFRCIELGGILSLRDYKKYSYKIDSTYYIKDSPVYRVRFDGRGDNGTIHVFADNQQILEIECTTKDLWSTAFHKRVNGKVKIRFNYFDETPFLSSVESYYNYQGLEHNNSLTVLLQKLDKFEMNRDEYWSMNAYSGNPFIEFSPEKWETYNILRDNDYSIIASDLNLRGITLEEQFVNFSGRWLNRKGTKAENARSKIIELKSIF